MDFIKKNGAGLLLCLCIAIPAWLLGQAVPVVGGPVFSILIGMVLTLFWKDKTKVQPGIGFTSKKVLQYAVILLGFGLNLSEIAKVGAQSLPIIVSTIGTSLIVSFVLCKAMKVPSNISTLVGVGSSICGGSAIAATAPVIGADDEEIAQAISVIFLFNVIAALTFPTLGGMLGMTDHGFGLFAGTAVNDTSSVTAAASAWDGIHGSNTLEIATIVKLTRTLAIILYGDLDISVIDELPSNRKPIKNCVVDISYRQTAYRFMEKQIAEGRQCYVICPMVEAGEDSADGLENVTDYTEKLKAALNSSIRVAALHGKMKAAQKQEIMDAFGAGQIDVLVSTTVIEVGINVPNATVMLVENAERFGLAQLHQLRGRVGRGHAQSFCIFMTGDGSGAKNKRLDVLNHSNDGFFIANEDLKLRGPGDLFGIRQSGDLDFGLGDIYQDSDVLMLAGELADQVLSGDVVLPEKEFGLFEKSIDYRTI